MSALLLKKKQVWNFLPVCNIPRFVLSGAVFDLVATNNREKWSVLDVKGCTKKNWPLLECTEMECLGDIGGETTDTTVLLDTISDIVYLEMTWPNCFCVIQSMCPNTLTPDSLYSLMTNGSFGKDNYDQIAPLVCAILEQWISLKTWGHTSIIKTRRKLYSYLRSTENLEQHY